MENRPSKKQRELLSFIDGFIKGYGYGPSYREIMRALDYKSVSTVATHVNGLITKGWLIKKDNAARTLEVVMPGDEPKAEVQVKNKQKNTAEHEIKAKLDELRQYDLEQNAESIAVLVKALDLLGYDDNKDTLA
jgi:repressor LexA